MSNTRQVKFLKTGDFSLDSALGPVLVVTEKDVNNTVFDVPVAFAVEMEELDIIEVVKIAKKSKAEKKATEAADKIVADKKAADKIVADKKNNKDKK